MKPNKKQIPPIMVEPELYEKAKETAKKESRSLSNLIRTAIEKYCDKSDAESR